MLVMPVHNSVGFFVLFHLNLKVCYELQPLPSFNELKYIKRSVCV